MHKYARTSCKRARARFIASARVYGSELGTTQLKLKYFIRAVTNIIINKTVVNNQGTDKDNPTSLYVKLS